MFVDFFSLRIQLYTQAELFSRVSIAKAFIISWHGRSVSACYTTCSLLKILKFSVESIAIECIDQSTCMPSIAIKDLNKHLSFTPGASRFFQRFHCSPLRRPSRDLFSPKMANVNQRLLKWRPFRLQTTHRRASCRTLVALGDLNYWFVVWPAQFNLLEADVATVGS